MSRPISHRRQPAEAESKEGGYTLAMLAILLVPMMLMAALAVDVGSWYVEAQEVQRAADAAALAGVPFMPDFFNDAEAKARATAAKNGYTHGVNGVTVAVAPVTGNRRRLRVTITDPRVTTYFGIISKDRISVSRSAIAEYVLPVPLGSPRNYLGTGTLGKTSGAFAPEYLWASINGYCTRKREGDQRASFYALQKTCDGAVNGDYTHTNYQYSIELPAAPRTYSTDIIIFDGNYQPTTADPNDFNPSTHPQSGMSTTFTLFQPDPTPLDDFDNPTVEEVPSQPGVPDVSCSSTGSGRKGTKTFGPGGTEGGYTFNPSTTLFNSSSNWWQLCRIPSTALGGRYILRVTNQLPPPSPQQPSNPLQLTQGSNNFGIAATPSSPQKICDARTDPSCPKVYANEYLSVRAAAVGSTADFFLSEIGPEHKGKKVVITLWDPAEGGKSISLKRPNATNGWTTQNFNWTATSNDNVPPPMGDGGINSTSGTNVSSIPINATSENFTGELVTISFTLPTNYAPPTDNEWWKISYEFQTTGTVSDRTTWSVSIVGDPVHLVG